MIRAFQWDLARQVERLDWLLAQLPRYADWGYNELYLHLEDAVEYPSLPGIARRDAYSRRDFGRLVDAATRVGIRVVPIVNLLGHTQYLVKVPELRDLIELRGSDGAPLDRGQICPVHPRTLDVAEKLLRDMAPFCTAGKVHVGLDESFHLGKHPLSRREIARIGLPAHFARYVGRLRELTRSLDLGMGLWGDMLYFLPGAVPLLPKDVSVYEWYYYPFARRPRVELFNFAETDLGERLRARGIAYWGCPMNGAFRFEPLPHFGDRLANILSWWRRCQRLNAEGFLVTGWEPNRLALELTTVVDAAAASLWLNPGIDAPRAMLEKGFERVFGRSTAKPAARLALACDRYPFAGYPRWESNTRWDVLSPREAVKPYRAEERALRRLRDRAKAERVPSPLRASVELRWALAARDTILRDASTTPATSRQDRAGTPRAALRQVLASGLKAARRMWTSTRDPETRGPNEEILLANLAMADHWRAGKPVFGPRWKLCYRVDNREPAAQLVCVEQRTGEGSAWRTVQACHTIEFQGVAAKRRGGLCREHAAPVEWDGDAAGFPELRFVLRGLGRVWIRDVALTDGRRSWQPRRTALTLGRPAPRHGMPELDWTANAAIAAIAFRRAR
jgi:hypothetical protein